MKMKKTYLSVRVADLKPYANNPRKNGEAVKYVKESIYQVGYITPIVVDENMEVLAGHTRLAALSETGITDVDVLLVEGLTEEEKKKFRLLDNKTGEFASWDFKKLEQELDGVDFDGFDFDFATADLSLDVSSDDDGNPVEAKPKDEQEIICPNCGMKLYV